MTTTLDSLIEELEKFRSNLGGDTEVRTHEVTIHNEYELTVDETNMVYPDVRNDKGVTYVFIGE